MPHVKEPQIATDGYIFFCLYRSVYGGECIRFSAGLLESFTICPNDYFTCFNFAITTSHKRSAKFTRTN